MRGVAIIQSFPVSVCLDRRRPRRGGPPGNLMADYVRIVRVDVWPPATPAGLSAGAALWQDAQRPVTPLHELSDADLLHRIVARDEGALAQLYDRHSRLVYSIAMRVLRVPLDAEEVLQETFVRVWSRADSYESRLGSPAAWLTRISRNCAIDRLRAKRVRQDVDAPPPVETEDSSTARRPEPATTETPEDLAQASATAGLLRGAMRSLPDAQRLLIEAAFFDGCTHAELAERFALPLGTVKARIRTGLLALRSQLAHAV